MGMFIGIEEVEIVEIKKKTMIVELRDAIIYDCVVINRDSEKNNAENVCRYIYEYINYHKEYRVYYCDFFI